MASRTSTPEKRPGFFSQIRSLYTFTQKEFRWLPWLLAGFLLVGVWVGVLIGFLIPPVAIWGRQVGSRIRRVVAAFVLPTP